MSSKHSGEVESFVTASGQVSRSSSVPREPFSFSYTTSKLEYLVLGIFSGHTYHVVVVTHCHSLVHLLFLEEDVVDLFGCEGTL